MKKILHPKYNGATLRNDLALLMLDSPVDTKVYVPICLSNPNTNYTSLEAMVLGWGHNQYGGELSDILQELRMTIVQDEDCYMSIRVGLQMSFCPDRAFLLIFLSGHMTM